MIIGVISLSFFIDFCYSIVPYFHLQELKKTIFYAQIDECVWEKNWVVHAEPAGYGQEIIKYVAPYVYRIAINNHKIKQLEGRKVTFEYEDYETKKTKECTLDVIEFMRRFLQHVLPPGFVKVRYFGIMGANEKDEWFLLKQLIYQLLSAKNKTKFLKIDFFQATKQKYCCKNCGGELILFGTLKRGP